LTRLFTVMRLPDLFAIYGFVSAAAEAGWDLDHTLSAQVQISEERLPALVFVKRKIVKLSEESVFSWFRQGRINLTPDDIAHLDYCAAAVANTP
jgi:hypothetical protein